MEAKRMTLWARYSTLFAGTAPNTSRYKRSTTRAKGLKWPATPLSVALILFSLLFFSGTKVLSVPGSLAAADPPQTSNNAVFTGDAGTDSGELQWANLSGADLRSARLSRATLIGADLSQADLQAANLTGAALSGANLSGANLAHAHLERADLHWATLCDAELRSADLRRANLRRANLEGADLRGADLRYADMEDTYLSGAVLPDGHRWTPSSDLARFTDAGHPDFWTTGTQHPNNVRMRHLPE